MIPNREEGAILLSGKSFNSPSKNRGNSRASGIIKIIVKEICNNEKEQKRLYHR